MNLQKNNLLKPTREILFYSGNMIRGLDSDECDFLSTVESIKAKQDLEKTKVTYLQIEYFIDKLCFHTCFKCLLKILSTIRSFGIIVNKKYGMVDLKLFIKFMRKEKNVITMSQFIENYQKLFIKTSTDACKCKKFIPPIYHKLNISKINDFIFIQGFKIQN